MTADPQDILVDSPLVMHTPGARLAGIVALDRFLACNGVAVEAGPPLSLTMPSARWAFGVVFPLEVHRRRTPGDQPIVIALTLKIEDGTVGIMGVGEDLERPTTPETMVGPGRTTACLTLVTPSLTSAIVLRNVGETGSSPRVAVREIAAYRTGPRRLVPRTHDLGFDLFVVLAPGKTGTQTVEQTLLGLAPNAQVRRVHQVSPKATPVPAYFGPDNSRTRAEHKESEYGRRVAEEIALVRASRGRVAFITAIREPIDGAISGVFQSLPETISAFEALHALGPQFVDLLILGLQTQLRRLTEASADERPSDVWLWRFPDPMRWFYGQEFRRVTGVDLLAHPVDHHAGFTLLREPRESLLVFRFEDIAHGLVPGLAALTGRRTIELRNANRADDKPYRSLYRELRGRFRIPRELADEIYRDPYVRHFYTPDEIAAFKARWT